MRLNLSTRLGLDSFQRQSFPLRSAKQISLNHTSLQIVTSRRAGCPHRLKPLQHDAVDLRTSVPGITQPSLSFVFARPSQLSPCVSWIVSPNNASLRFVLQGYVSVQPQISRGSNFLFEFFDSIAARAVDESMNRNVTAKRLGVPIAKHARLAMS